MPLRRPPPSVLGRAEEQLRVLRPVLAAHRTSLEARDMATVESQERLAQLAAPTGGESRRAALVADAFRLRGFAHVRLDAVGNVIAHRPGVAALAAAPVVCMAHLDTVFAADTPLHLRRDGERIICPGIGDNARGLAGMLAIADTFGVPGLDGDALELARPIEFVATVGEEGLGNLRGARAYFDALAAEGTAPHAVLALDGPGDERIVHHALGSRRYRVTLRGPGGHSWADFGRPNPIHAAGRATHWLARMPSEARGQLAVSVGRIGGGASLTAIPTLAWLEVDVRAMDEPSLDRANASLRAIVQQAVHEENRMATEASLYAEIEVLGERPAGGLAPDHPLVALAIAATRSSGGEPLSAVASTDANIPLARGIPAITLGAGGRGGGAHTADEWYENSDGARGLSRAAAVLAVLAR
jgi:tripeptide aminopeptidase